MGLQNLRVALQNSLVADLLAADPKDSLEAIISSKVVVHTLVINRACLAPNTAD